MTSLPYYSGGGGPVPRMRYWAAYRFLWTSPNGWKNLLFAGVCVLIPVVGLLVLVGYVRDILLARLDTLDDDRIGYPDFDFNHFVEYLTRGLWPFVVSLVASLAVLPVFALLGIMLAVVLPALNPRGPALVVAIALFALLIVALSLLLNVLMVPLMLRAALLEEFGPSFSWPWISDFARRMWPEILLSWLFLMVTAFPLAIVGYAMCLVGVYPAMALMTIAQWHLHFQIYRIYLARGGTYVPPKITPLYPPAGGFPPPIPQGPA